MTTDKRFHYAADEHLVDSAQGTRFEFHSQA